jgi:hypothetical protein
VTAGGHPRGYPDALAVMLVALERGRTASAYRCGRCGQWHARDAGSRARRVARRLAERRAR